jgi:hypothetical protein
MICCHGETVARHRFDEIRYNPICGCPLVRDYSSDFFMLHLIAVQPSHAWQAGVSPTDFHPTIIRSHKEMGARQTRELFDFADHPVHALLESYALLGTASFNLPCAFS